MTHPRRALNATKYVVVLECDHVVRIPPEVTDAVGFSLKTHDCDECGPSCDCRICRRDRAG